MVSLRKTIHIAHQALSSANIDHALIGGIALSTFGINRATADVDLLADGSQKKLIKSTLIAAGFHLQFESEEVLQFTGAGFLDILLANRPMSTAMLKNAKSFPSVEIKCLEAEDIIGLKIQAYVNNRKRELQDKADILSLLEKYPHLDWVKIKKYADLFQEWSALEELREKL